MTTFISLLRGINVTGKKLIKMEALRAIYEDLGFQNVETYLQSGNVIFSALDIEARQIEKRISDRIENDFGFLVTVIVLSVSQLSKIITNNPLLEKENIDPTFLHVTFLSSRPKNIDFGPIEKKCQNRAAIFYSDNSIYLFCPDGYGKTKLTNNFLEKNLKTGATTRNWKTINELLKIAQNSKTHRCHL